MKIFSPEKLLGAIKRNGLNELEFRKLINVSRQRFDTWKAGTVPQGNTLGEISEVLNVPIDDLYDKK